MKRIALALLASAALSMPALAASDMNQPTQQPQAQQQSQAQQKSQPSQAQNTLKQNTQKPKAQAQNAPKQNTQSMKSSQAQPANNSKAAPKQANNMIAPKSLSGNQVRQVQQALNKDGFQVGQVDGHWGPKTVSAVKKFQQSKDIQANGQLSQQTISDLGLNGAQFAQH